MSPLFGFSVKRAARGRRPYKPGAAPGLGAALFKLLEDAPAEEPRRKGRRARVEFRALEAMEGARWATECARPGGEILYLRSGSDEPRLSILARDHGEARDDLAAAIAALAALAARAGDGADGWSISAQAADQGALAFLSCRVGGGRAFSGRSGSLLVHVDETLASSIEGVLASGDPPLDELEPVDPASLPPLTAFSVDRNQDFALAHFFLPPGFALPAASGSVPAEVAVFWDSVSQGGAMSRDALWFAGGLGDAKSGIALLFECGVPPKAEREGFAARVLPVLREGWARAARRLASFAPQGSSPRFGALAQPPAGLLAGAARVSGELRLGLGGFAVAVHLTPRLVSALAGSLRPRPATLGPVSLAAEILSVNEALLGRWGPALRDPLLKPRTPPGSSKSCVAPPLAALLGAMGRRDAAVVAQNCLIPRFGAQELPYLFFYHASIVRNGRRAMRPHPLAAFRDTDITRLLPPGAREEWEQERRFDLPRRTIPPEDCAAANDEAARLIWEAARTGRLELSRGSLVLIEEWVGKRLAETARAELAALSEGDVPFGFLASLGRGDAVRIVDRIPNKDLALASVGDSRHIDLLKSCMGSGRKRDFADELSIAEARIGRGELGVEKASAMKLSLLSRMKEIEEDLKRERAAG